MADPVRYYFDENVWGAVADGLRRLGIDVLTAQDAGRARRRIPDPDQLAFAAAEGRVLVTFDTDYLTLHAAGTAHAGLAWCPEQKHTIGGLIAALALIHGVYTADDMVNTLEYL